MSDIDHMFELGWLGYEHSDCDSSCPERQNYIEAKTALKQLISEAEIKARIDELNKIPQFEVEYVPGNAVRHVLDRLKELKS